MQIGVDSQRSVENKRVFVVDDNDVNSMGLQFILADENETHLFPSIAAAVEKAKNWPPHLVLLGIGYIRREGSGAVAQIKAAMNDVKVLLVCDSADKVSTQDAIAQGANGTLVTPLTIEGVRRKVDSALGRAVPIAIPVVQG